MNREFSNGFIQDLAFLLEECKKGNTDSIELQFDVNGNKLIADITFKAGENKHVIW